MGATGVSGLNSSGWKSVFGWLWDPPVTMEQSQVSVSDPDIPEVVDCMKATLLILRKGTVLNLHQCQVGTPMKPADRLPMQGIWDWLYDDGDINPSSMPITQVRVNAVA